MSENATPKKHRFEHWQVISLYLILYAFVFRLILFEVVKIGHIRPSCGYLAIKDERRQRLLLYIIMYYGRRARFPRPQAAGVRSG